MTHDPTGDLLQAALRPLQLLDRLDAGGMGEIYLARDPLLRRTVAVKVLRAELAERDTDRARFFREAEAIAGISHPNVIGIHAVAELADGRPYFVMDYVAGHSVAHRLATTGSYSVRESRAVLAQVAAALAASHARGVVHRDIKPENVLFEPETGRALVTDFGVAAFREAPVDSAGDARLTQTGTWVGSPAYMSPEQFLGDEVTPATDVYALGLLAYDLLLGRGPFERASPQRMMVAHVSESPEPLRALRGDVDPELDALVGRCLQKDPSARPSAAEIARLLDPGGEAVIEWPPPGLDRLRGAAYPLARAVAAGFALLLGPLVLGAWPGGLSPDGLAETLWFVGYLLCAVLGCVFLGRAGLLLGAITRGARAASGWGYRLGALAEVLADRRGDTGHLIAGLREYATLEPDRRARLRRGRVLAAVAMLAAALALPAGLLLALRHAAAGTPVGWVATILAVLPALGFWMLSLRTRRAEHGLLAEPRRALARGPGDEAVARLVPQWYQALDQAAAGAGLPPGRRVRPWVVRVVEAGAAAAALAMLLVTGAIAIVLIMGMGDRAMLPEFGSGIEGRIERTLELGHLRLPVDPAIDPATARRMIQDLPPLDEVAREWRTPRPTQETIAGSPLVAGPSPLGAPYSITLDSVIPVAFRGLSDAERAYLRGFGGDPRSEVLAVAARAGAIGPPPAAVADDVHVIFDMPLPHFGRHREVAYHRVAYAGWLAGEGRVEDAEAVLREVVSAGLRLTNDAYTLTEAIVGFVVVGIGAWYLAQVYEHTGRTGDAEAVLGAYRGPPDAGETDILEPGTALTRAQQLDGLLRTVADPEAPAGLRWELLIWVAPATTCHDLRGLVRGPPPETVAALDQARTHLVRSPADSVLFAAATELMDRMHEVRYDLDPGPHPFLVRTARRGVRAAARLLRNPRLDSCFTLLTQI